MGAKNLRAWMGVEDGVAAKYWAERGAYKTIFTIILPLKSPEIDSLIFTQTVHPDGPAAIEKCALMLIAKENPLIFGEFMYDLKANLLYISSEEGDEWIGAYAPGAMINPFKPYLFSSTNDEPMAILDYNKTSVNSDNNSLNIMWRAGVNLPDFIFPSSPLDNFYIYTGDLGGTAYIYVKDIYGNECWSRAFNNEEGWIKTYSGLEYRDVVVGTGKTAYSGSTITINYSGWTADFYCFDTSAYDGNGAKTFSLNMLIDGLREGIQGMKVGGIREFRIPSYLGYGAWGTEEVPEYATLWFHVQLLDVL